MVIDHRRLQQFTAAQAGVLSVEQAELCGLSRRMVQRRVATRQWTKVLPKVVSPLGHLDGAARVHAAMLWAGPGSVLVGPAALWWWRLVPKPPAEVSVVLPEHRPRSSASFVTVRRFRVPDADRTTERGVRLVSKPYAVLFAGRDLGKSAQTLLDRALLLEFDLERFRAVLERNANCLGAEEARGLLRIAGDGAAAESERVLIRLLRSAGIEGWVVNRGRRLGGKLTVPDFTFERQRVLVEVDGWAFHSDPERFERDRRRQNAYVTAGWLVLRFTWAQLHDHPQEVIDTILAALVSRTREIDR